MKTFQEFLLEQQLDKLSLQGNKLGYTVGGKFKEIATLNDDLRDALKGETDIIAALKKAGETALIKHINSKIK